MTPKNIQKHLQAALTVVLLSTTPTVSYSGKHQRSTNTDITTMTLPSGIGVIQHLDDEHGPSVVMVRGGDKSTMCDTYREYATMIVFVTPSGDKQLVMCSRKGR